MNNLKRNIKAVVFDVDETLTTNVSWTYITEALGADKDIHIRIFQQFKENKITYPEAKLQLLELWAQTGNDNKSHMIKSFKKIPLRKGSKTIVAKIKKSYITTLISGSMDLYVDTVANKLGINEYYSNTELIFDERDKLIDFNYYRNQAEKKMNHLEEFLAKHALKNENCAVIGNGENDLLLFKACAISVLLSNSANADYNNEVNYVINNLSELENILL